MKLSTNIHIYLGNRIELGMHNKSTGIPRRIGLSWAEFRRLRFVLIDKNINREPAEEGLRYFCPVCNNLRCGNHGPTLMARRGRSTLLRMFSFIVIPSDNVILTQFFVPLSSVSVKGGG